MSVVSIIAAIDEQRGLGKNNQLLCHLPADLAHFKAQTLGKPIIMGRTTHAAIGRALPEAVDAHHRLWDVTEAGFEAARAGVSCSELFAIMAKGLGEGSDVGRIGHGLGMQLTEWPSIAAHDHTVLQAGMVMTLEPSLMIDDNRMMVVEENILITDGAPEMLTTRVKRDIEVI